MLKGVDTLKLHQRHDIGTETVFLEEKRHQQSVNHDEHEIGLLAVEHVVVEREGYLPLHSMRLAEAAYAIYVT